MFWWPSRMFKNNWTSNYKLQYIATRLIRASDASNLWWASLRSNSRHKHTSFISDQISKTRWTHDALVWSALKSKNLQSFDGIKRLHNVRNLKKNVRSFLYILFISQFLINYLHFSLNRKCDIGWSDVYLSHFCER